MPVFQVNKKMMAIVTNIISSSGLVVKAITYFEPETDGSNTWYPTIVTKMSADILPIKEMQENKNFTGTMEFLSSTGNSLNRTHVKNNLIVDANYSSVLSLKDKTIKNSISGEIMYEAEGEGSKCMRAVISCWHSEVLDMGLVEYVGYCAGFPNSALQILADCMIHEKACLGILKMADVL